MRLLFFKRKPGDEPRREGLARAREDVMEQMRQRLDEPQPIVVPDVAPAPEETPDPLAGLGEAAAPDPLAALGAPSPVAADGAAPADSEGSQPKDPFDDALDMDLLDIFRDAKKETEEGSLAGQVEEVSIADLLGDVETIRSRLGIKARPAPPPEPEPKEPPVTQEEIAEPEIEAAAQAESAPSIVVELIPDDEAAAEPAPEPAVEPEEAVVPEELLDTCAMAVAETAKTEPGPVEAIPPEGETLLLASPAQDYDASVLDENVETITLPARGADHGRRYLLHVLFFGLALAAAAGAGLRTAHHSGALAAAPAPAPAPAILAYLKAPMVIPDPVRPPDVRDLVLDAVSATPAPTPTPPPTPKPDPRQYGFQGNRAAWVVYTIASGDNLASIGKTFGICPDHIIWSNPGRAIGDSLTVGEKLILPGYPGLVYRVQEGDRIASIAARYSTDPGMVLAYPGNKLSGDSDLEPGKSILLPEGIPPEAFMQSAEARWAYTHPSDEGYIWPFYGPITSRFGEQRPGYTHAAIDIGGLYQFGTPVLAVAHGRVEKAVNDDEGYSSEGYGNHVIIEHDDGSRSLYAHLTKVYVEEGDEVKQAQPLGGLGCTGHSTGTHLHFELYRNGGAVDPLAYLPDVP
jgi:murein DD-endopeptidase MepM/ murein hydrolase activator NlpD